jgi:hypothetical protein
VGEYVEEGRKVGDVLSPGGDVIPIRSHYAGWLMGYLAPDRSPVREAEPVCWLSAV